MTETSARTGKTTPLHAVHVDLGARMTPFAGYEMPVQYAGIIEEHLAVRRAAGLFDVSHMGEILVRGPHAATFAQHLVTNDVDTLYDGKALYTVMCREDGGIVDDLIIYRLAADEFLFVVNAANHEKDFQWMIQHNAAKAEIEDISDDVALIAVQGPRSLPIVEKALGEAFGDLTFYHVRPTRSPVLAGSDLALVSRTGYTGEMGFEIYCHAGTAVSVWKTLMEAGQDEGLKPAGLGARDTLRIEAGYCLYGNDITDETNPLEAGLGWLTKLDSADFIGRDALVAARDEGLERKLVAFVMQERGIPRKGYEILAPDEVPIGLVTSGTQSPVLEQGIGLGYVENDPDFTSPGSELLISVRGRTIGASVRKPPLHKA
jgi:aminomethyltransferase